jgi:tRNA threonylcarbamoyladenosine biosynthesis protein TsaE
MSRTWQTTSASPEETQRIARTLGAACQGGEVFLLIGPLGAGKTCFVQGLAQGLGVTGYVHSPTFVLVAQHQGRLTLHHADLYRIESPGEALDLALDEAVESGGVLAVEWADRQPAVFPRDHLRIEIADLGESKRRIVLTTAGARHERLLDTLAPASVPEGR